MTTIFISGRDYTAVLLPSVPHRHVPPVGLVLLAALAEYGIPPGDGLAIHLLQPQRHLRRTATPGPGTGGRTAPRRATDTPVRAPSGAGHNRRGAVTPCTTRRTSTEPTPLCCCRSARTTACGTNTLAGLSSRPTGRWSPGPGRRPFAPRPRTRSWPCARCAPSTRSIRPLGARTASPTRPTTGCDLAPGDVAERQCGQHLRGQRLATRPQAGRDHRER